MSAVRNEPVAAPAPVIFHSVVEDGIFVGVIGASLLAAWVLILDLMRGHAFHTPALLGTLVRHGPQAMGSMTAIEPQAVAVYTGIHFASFVMVGIVTSYMWAQFEHFPILGFVMLVGFAAFEVGFFALDFALGLHLVGHLSTWSIWVGNLVAAAGMFAYLRSRHPKAMQGMSRLWSEE